MKATFSFLFALVGSGIAVLWAGCAAAPTESPVIAHKSPPSSDVRKIEAWKDAEKVAAQDEGRLTLIGSGESMRPIYGEGTVLVISKIEYEKLKPGMQVAYVNAAGRRVVHVLLSMDGTGWRVRGLNNDEEDDERVTRFNLLGVVYASFATDQD